LYSKCSNADQGKERSGNWISTVVFFHMSYFRDNESGGFSEEGITSEIINGTILQCFSDHLTSFALLVDTTGTNVWKI